MFKYNQPLVKNSLPTSLTMLALKMDSSTTSSSFQDVDVLDKLKYLTVDLLQPSLSRVLSKCKYLHIESFNPISPGFSLHDSSIERLILFIRNHNNPVPIPLDAILPHKLERLALFGFTISSCDIIPPTCFYLKTDIPNFNRKLFAPSVIMYRSARYGNHHKKIKNLN